MKENKCPEFDDISAWHDGESTTDYSKHIEECPECKDVIEDLKKMDLGLNHILSDELPSSQLKEKILNQTFKPKRIPIMFSHALKIAAVLITAFFINFFLTPEAKEQPVVSDSSPENKVIMTSIPKETDPDYSPIAESPKSVIPNQDFTLVSTSKNTQTNEAIDQPLNDQIEHVWIFSNPDTLVDQLKTQLINNKSLKSKTDESGSLHITVYLNESALIKTVNWLSQNGGKLVSRDLPQPNQSFTSLNPKKIVKYKFSVIKKQ